MAREQRSVTLADYRKVVKKYESGAKSHVAIAEQLGVDANVAWEIGAAIGARNNGASQREAYQKKVSGYLARGGVAEKGQTPWIGYTFPAGPGGRRDG